jgi:hypothetical protein
VNKIIITAVLGMFATNMAFAAGNGCEAKAVERKLAGAAKNNFIKNCNKDAAIAATAACGQQATYKILAGFARNNFTTKCEKDAAAAK